RANKNIRPPGDLRGQRQSNVQLGTRIQILANHKIQSASRNISRRSLVPSDKFFSGESDADWQCQVIASRRAAFFHYGHPRLRSWLPSVSHRPKILFLRRSTRWILDCFQRRERRDSPALTQSRRESSLLCPTRNDPAGTFGEK